MLFEPDVGARMRDDAVLRADVYRPAGPGRHPVIVCRTPYDKSNRPGTHNNVDALRTAAAGYAVVVQDTRGRYASGGRFVPFEHERDDGYDTVEWAAAQAWSTGEVGMVGTSYVGYDQWLAALAAPPHLRAIFPILATSDLYTNWVYEGGAFSRWFNVSWSLASLGPDSAARADSAAEAGRSPASMPSDGGESRLSRVIAAIDDLEQYLHGSPGDDLTLLDGLGLGDAYRRWLEHPTRDAYWDGLSVESHRDAVTIPSYSVGGWYDVFLGGTLANYRGMRRHSAASPAREGARLLVGPWQHGHPLLADPAGEAQFGLRAAGADVDIGKAMLRFFDLWLRGEDDGLSGEPRVRIFVMGSNEWRTEEEWPLARAVETPLYLRSGGHANGLEGDGVLSWDSPSVGESSDGYVSDPLEPVPTRGGNLCCWQLTLPPGAFDQRAVEARSDVLVFTGPVLKQDMELTGPVRVVLFASSSAPACDFTAKLVDVHPNGYARNLAEGIVRVVGGAAGHDGAQPLTESEPAQLEIDLWATSNVFRRGHRIRLEIASSNAPRFDVNPQTGCSSAQEVRPMRAHQRVFHDASRPSRLVLPVVPRG